MELIASKHKRKVNKNNVAALQNADKIIGTPEAHNNTAPSTNLPFIQANTEISSLEEIKEKHIIPVFIKDNEPVISQVDFIETASSVIADIFKGEQILKPSVRVSHPIKGRIPEARNKAAVELQEHEKTIYFDRMAFVIEIPSIAETIENNHLSLCIGGVKAYNLDNLYNRKGTDEHFKCFIGFKNSVCTNLCISTDGFKSNFAVKSIGELKAGIRLLLENYNASYHLHSLKSLTAFHLTEEQFAKIIGKCRMYPHVPKYLQADIPPLLLCDTQIAIVVKDYFRDNSFCRNDDGTINLWRLYNLFTGANRSSYIDNFLDRNVNAFSFVYALKMALAEGNLNWFLN